MHSFLGQSIPVSDHIGDFNPSQISGINQLILLPAGTGFTPMTKLTQALLSTPDSSKKKATMIFFNKTPNDIMWREILEDLASTNEAFEIHNVLSQDPEWKGEKGRISKDILERLLPRKDETGGGKRLAGICGPIPYTREAKR